MHTHEFDNLKNYLDLTIEQFYNQLITNKVHEINCNFIDYIIKNSPQHISYLDEYYKYFYSIDINIIKNAKTLQGEELIVYYCNIDTKNMEEKTYLHISNFIKTNKITNNILNLFKIDTENINNKLEEKEKEMNISIKNDFEKNKQDILILKSEILDIKRNIEQIKNDNDEKFNKLFMIISHNINNS